MGLYSLPLLVAALLLAAELGERQALAVALNRGQTPRKSIEGALKDASLFEGRHELEENLARLGGLEADERSNRGALGNRQVGAVKGRKNRGGRQIAGYVATGMDAEGDHLIGLKNLGKRNGSRSLLLLGARLRIRACLRL